jgi:hypothetical protein
MLFVSNYTPKYDWILFDLPVFIYALNGNQQSFCYFVIVYEPVLAAAQPLGK